jgi:hypothetical protein
MNFSIEEIKESVNKFDTVLTAFCDKNNNIWISSVDINNFTVSIYLQNKIYSKIKNLTVSVDGFGKYVIFFEYHEEIYLLVCSNLSLYFYKCENFDEIYFKYDVEKKIENIIERNCNFYIKSEEILCKFNFEEKTRENLSIENIGLFDINYDGEYYANYYNNKLQIYKNFNIYREYNLKNCEKIKFINETCILVCEKNNIKIYDVVSEKNMYKSLYHCDSNILDTQINICTSGKCYASLKCEKYIHILEYYDNNFILLKTIEKYKLFDYVSIFDKIGNYYLFVENLAKKNNEYNNDLEKEINTKLKFVEFYENNSNFDFCVDILFDDKNKTECEFAKLFSVYFEKILEFLEKDDSNEDEKSVIKKLISNNLMIKKLFYDTKFTIYKHHKQIVAINNDEIYDNNKKYKLYDEYDEIIKNVCVMDNCFYAILKKNDNIIFSPYLCENEVLKFNENIVIKNEGENINIFFEGNFNLNKESIDISNMKKYNSCKKNIYYVEKNILGIGFDKKYNINTFILGYGNDDDDFPKYSKKNNNFMIKIRENIYLFDVSAEEIDKLHIIMELEKEKIEKKNKKDFIEYVEKTGLFDEYYKTKLVCEMKNGEIIDKYINFNPFDLNMIFYNKTNVDIDIVINAFAVEKINIMLLKKNIFCSKVLDKNTIKILNFSTKKEYFENEIIQFYENLKY